MDTGYTLTAYVDELGNQHVVYEQPCVSVRCAIGICASTGIIVQLTYGRLGAPVYTLAHV